MGSILPIGVGILIFAFMFHFAITSLRERERRAARMAFLLSLLLPLPYILVGSFAWEYREQLSVGLLSLTGLIVLLLVLPIRWGVRPEDDTPGIRIDERDTMFSRDRLIPGSERFESYYADNPHKRRLDDRFRSQPGLLKEGSRYYDPVLCAAADATFTTVEKLLPSVEGPTSERRNILDPAAMTRLVKRWAVKLGAVSAGVTELRDYHLYSRVGRGPDYGQSVELAHSYAIAITVEMDRAMLDHAPLAATVMESAQQYLASGVIAVQIAHFIRNLGYEARAHIDGNYRVVCPLVARDAGLGEIGRIGLLMTPELGPRVRIAVVTTDLPLAPEERHRLPMIDFCTRCKKCADACPSRAIPFEDRTEIDGVRRWQIDPEACFTFWCTAGTDMHPRTSCSGCRSRSLEADGALPGPAGDPWSPLRYGLWTLCCRVPLLTPIEHIARHRQVGDPQLVSVSEIRSENGRFLLRKGASIAGTA